MWKRKEKKTWQTKIKYMSEVKNEEVKEEEEVEEEEEEEGIQSSNTYT